MEAVADFTKYPQEARDSLVTRLAGVCSELANAHIIYASTAQQEKSARIQCYMRSEATSIAGKERDADAQALPLTLGLIELIGSIKALSEERDLILFILGDQSARTGGPVANDQGLPPGDQG